MFKYIISILIMFNLSIDAKIIVNKSTKTVEGIGVGLNREEAVNNAIIEALGQLNGINIQQQKFISDTSIESSTEDSSTYIYNNTINRVTKGKVDSYSILEVTKYDNEFEARVSISKTKIIRSYKTPGLNTKNRRNIVVVPTYSEKEFYNILGEKKNYFNIRNNFTQELISSITKTRKFNILDRKFNQAFNNERKILKSYDSQKGEILKLGKVLGADYLFITKIIELDINLDSSASKIVANFTESKKVNATIEYNIVTLSTREIKWADTKSYNFEVNSKTKEQSFIDALKQISERITSELIENIYPIKIIHKNGKELTLNQGSIPIGTKFEVFKLGKKIYDSYNKEFLGQDEILVGEIKVTRALSKVSKANIIKGNISNGYICRKVQIEANNHSSIPKNYGGIKKTANGGVILPFD